MNNKGTFSTLNPEAEIFKVIKSKQPAWWKLIVEDEELYIDVRKDNYINVYYLGGSLTKIQYKDGFLLEIHHKYLNLETSKKTYVLLDPELLDKVKIEDIKSNIKNSLRNLQYEHPSEKRIQGELIIQNSNYIDSEFQFNQDKKNGKLRIDLIELKNGILSFVELKGISDNRLRNDEKRNFSETEIITQMKMYEKFISKYKNEIEEYYKKLIAIKLDLDLIKCSNADFILNLTPKLLIANTYKKDTKRRKERVESIKSLLKENNIKFEIIEWKS